MLAAGIALSLKKYYVQMVIPTSEPVLGGWVAFMTVKSKFIYQKH
ncbi:hypothetical protein NSP_50780 [Nodularia spumigena CCY9414]|nr:hypothetical protein NSP_50780 [Nodularia spumigena CCY9414]